MTSKSDRAFNKLLNATLAGKPERDLRQGLHDFVSATPCVSKDQIGLVRGTLDRLDEVTKTPQERAAFAVSLIHDRSYAPDDELAALVSMRLVHYGDEMEAQSSPDQAFSTFYGLFMHSKEAAKRATAEVAALWLDYNALTSDKALLGADQLLQYCGDSSFELDIAQSRAAAFVAPRFQHLAQLRSPTYAASVAMTALDAGLGQIEDGRKAVTMLMLDNPAPFLAETALPFTLKAACYAVQTQPKRERTPEQEKLSVWAAGPALTRLHETHGPATSKPAAEALMKAAGPDSQAYMLADLYLQNNGLKSPVKPPYTFKCSGLRIRID